MRGSGEKVVIAHHDASGAWVICPVCRREGQRSTVREMQTTVTLMNEVVLYDEQGHRQVLNPNVATTSYVCSRGHRFQEQSWHE